MAGPFLSLNGQRVISARVTMPYYGAWCADVTLAVPDNVPVASVLQLGDLKLSGTVFRMASFSGARSARLVAGAAGWRKTIPAQDYQNPGGILMSLVLKDAATLVGEQVSVASDASLGTKYVRENASAERLLRQLAGPEWYIDGNGVTQVGSRPSSPITSPFQVVNWSGGKGWFEVATETISDWLPGRTFSNAIVTNPQQIGMVSFIAENDGKLRVNVLSDGVGAQ